MEPLALIDVYKVWQLVGAAWDKQDLGPIVQGQILKVMWGASSWAN